MKSDKEKAIKKEDVKILKVKKAQKKTPEQIEEEKRLKAQKKAEEKNAKRSKGGLDSQAKKLKNASKNEQKTTQKAAKNEQKTSENEQKIETFQNGIDTDSLISETQKSQNYNTISVETNVETSEIYADASIGLRAETNEIESKAETAAKIKKRIVFLCTGNTCRSPMAEFIFKATAEKYGRNEEYEVSSAGLAADGGVGIAENSAFALATLGIPFTNRKSTQITVDIAKEADLIICMTANHKQAMGALNNCVTLSELCGCGDIPDPFGQSKEIYIATAKALNDAIESLFK